MHKIREVNQTTINQRLKFLIEKLGLNGKVFSEQIKESPTTTHNYTGKRQTEPRAQYLTKVLSHFDDVNARWLMTGEGDPFLPTATENTQLTANDQKFFRSQVIGSNQGTAKQQQNTTGEKLEMELKAAQKEIALLTSQLEVQTKYIKLLEAHQPKP